MPSFEFEMKKNEKEDCSICLRKLKKKEFEKGLDKIHVETPALIAKTLEEFEAIMEILDFSDAMKASTLAESKIEYERAVSKGYQCRFSVWIYRTVQKGYYMYIGTQINVQNVLTPQFFNFF